MIILLSNDDGYHADGLAALAAATSEFADIIIVAPDRNQSGASHSLTLDAPLRAEQISEKSYYVNGTPTDCVHLAITGLLDVEPDMVIAGINHGSNLGDDVLYSGTVAAAIEGRFLGLPAIAVSLCAEDPDHFATAAKAVCKLLGRLTLKPLSTDTILNVNVPDLPWEEVKGFAATRLGFRHRSESVVKTTDPKGQPIYWVGPAGHGQDAGTGTDFHAVEQGFVSVTPLQIDLTRHESMADLEEWVHF
ncbi:MAG: 5'/3'-nucleotidase SurE [Chromatiales bacterium]|jgi:5'-nucleotidase|nr:5'/3'-nucleotidase SurE [Chromatiales bacterium]MDP7093392.1 5'/3'-nucleotidase SurE [Gammaproteobacteria bacterium]MDP7271250.1 5'/3'-nucleotidase SurE [Gammaproteobacteria bacterium]HJP03699.1 5'/3'-nucleotidase SurE [Gammaproteobacteria bacterium]